MEKNHFLKSKKQQHRRDKRKVKKRMWKNANRRDIAKKNNPNLIVYSDVWMSMMDKSLSTTEGADTIENEKYSAEKNSIILWYDAFDAFHMVDEIALGGSKMIKKTQNREKIRNDIGKETSWLLAMCECEHCNIVTCCVSRSGCKFIYNRAHQRQRNHDDGDNNRKNLLSFYKTQYMHTQLI